MLKSKRLRFYLLPKSVSFPLHVSVPNVPHVTQRHPKSPYLGNVPVLAGVCAGQNGDRTM